MSTSLFSHSLEKWFSPFGTKKFFYNFSITRACSSTAQCCYSTPCLLKQNPHFVVIPSELKGLDVHCSDWLPLYCIQQVAIWQGKDDLAGEEII